MSDAGALRFRCLDTETTGLPDEQDEHGGHQMVEIGWTDVFWVAGGVPVVLEPRSMLVDPGRPIPPVASGIHHLRDVDVTGAHRPVDAVAAALSVPVSYLVAHPVDFDSAFIGAGDGQVPWICSHKSAVRVWEDAPDHKVQTLRYWLGVDDDPTFVRELAAPPHRAAPDSYVLAHVLARLLQTTPVERLVYWSTGPALLVTCYLPKHKGKRWAQVATDDRDYLHFIVDKSDLGRDIKATARYWLKKTERV